VTTVLALIVLIWSVAAAVYYLGVVRDGKAPADDLGFWWLTILALYVTLPPLSWWLQGGEYTPLTSRLYSISPTNADVTYLLLIGAAYATSFACVYWPIRRRANAASTARIAPIVSGQMWSAAIIVGITVVAGAIVSLYTERADSYTDYYRVIADMPLVLRQFLKVIGSMGSVATLVLLIAILQRWPRHRWPLFLYVGTVLIAFDPSGSRAGVAIRMFALAVAWHVVVRPIPTRNWAIGGTMGLLLFLAFGLLRGVQAAAELGGAELTGLGLAEFDGVWANALELRRAAEGQNLAVPFAAQYGEFWAFLPSQLLPFEKGDLSIWFLDTFWPTYKERGGGLAFGALSQAVIGGGVTEAAVRGAMLGGVAGALFRWHRSGDPRWWGFPVYLYLVVEVVQSVRDTTFRQLSDTVQLVLPSLVFIGIVGAVLSIVGRPRMAAVPPGATSPIHG
jgi:hypothetical protein